MQLANQQLFIDIILYEINCIPDMQGNIYSCLMD